MSLFPHEGFRPDVREKLLTDNELLVELAGRECYHSYGLKAGRKSNAEYIAHTQSGSIPHASIMYHAKMTFFLAGISRRVSHELIRHYVGADRSEEGSPSQESTRYTFHPGHFAVPPYVLDGGENSLLGFTNAVERTYRLYLDFVAQEEADYEDARGAKPTGIDRKRIYEAAAGLLPMQACTSMVWTTNPMALAKLFRERCDASADREFQRFATKWRGIAQARWPNLFPGSAA
jgi:thymidylate synthase (FAD)